MTKIENKVTTMKLSEDKMVTYANLVSTSISNFNMQNLVTVGQMRNLVKIGDIVDKAIAEESETFELDKDCLASIKQIVTDSKWPVIHRDIVEFVDYIESL